MKRPRRILMTGGSGLIGSHLVSFLGKLGHSVSTLKRGIDWDPASGRLPPEKVEGYDVIMNFSGSSIAEGLWTEERMQKIRTSRLLSTKLLKDTINKARKPPELFLSASAVGFYGDRGDEKLTEDAPAGSGFLATLCQEWEEEAKKVESSRVVLLRMGVVLSADGGALKKMLPLFRWGLGGKLGSGTQWMSWIAMNDLLWLIEFIMQNSRILGPVNACAPFPVTNAEFTKKLGQALHRPTCFSVPAWLLRLVAGKMADEALLASVRAIPQKIQAAGFQFSQPEIQLVRMI